MYTDWFLIRRLAWELAGELRGARLVDAGVLGDGRFAIELQRSRCGRLLCADLFAGTPVLTLEDGALPVQSEPRFVRAVVTALRGTVVRAVQSRTGDRLLRIEFSARSRFGVEDGYTLVYELVPRFGNAVLLKGETVVEAFKSFEDASGGRRAVAAGARYLLPPLKSGPASRMVDDAQAAQLAARETLDGDLYLYRDERGGIAQVHLVPLAEAQTPAERVPSLLACLAAWRTQRQTAVRGIAEDRRRREFGKALAARERGLQTELLRIEDRRRDAAARDELRERAEAIYATLHEVPRERQDECKAEATALFARYRKLGASLVHLDERAMQVQRDLADIQTLSWELERAEDAQLDDVAEALAPMLGQRQPHAPVRRRKRRPLQFRTASGALIWLGRTPVENAELTFRIAAPDDLWFHVQNQPGAHVILQRDGRGEPLEADILAAAALAAAHSKASKNAKVVVDYTQRKHVRKRPAAAPGLVFYTHPRSIVVEPGFQEVIPVEPRTPTS